MSGIALFLVFFACVGIVALAVGTYISRRLDDEDEEQDW